MEAPVEAALKFAFLPLAGKITAPPLAEAGEENCGTFATVLIVASLSLSYLSVAVTELDIIFLGLFLSPYLVSFAAILFV